MCITNYHDLIRHASVSMLVKGRRFREDWPWRKRDDAVARVVES